MKLKILVYNNWNAAIFDTTKMFFSQNQLYMKNFMTNALKIAVFLLIFGIAGTSCVKSQYQTAAGKKKNKRYNTVQYHKQPGTVNNKRNSTKF